MRCNQVQSGTIRYNHVQSGTIMYYQEQSGTIRYNRVQSGTIRYNQVQSGTIKYNQVQLGTIRYYQVPVGTSIPYIWHFFYTGRIFENQILHPKKRQKTPKTLKMSLKSQIYAVFHSIWKKFTPDLKILHGHRTWCPSQI